MKQFIEKNKGPLAYIVGGLQLFLIPVLVYTFNDYLKISNRLTAIETKLQAIDVQWNTLNALNGDLEGLTVATQVNRELVETVLVNRSGHGVTREQIDRFLKRVESRRKRDETGHEVDAGDTIAAPEAPPEMEQSTDNFIMQQTRKYKGSK